MSRSDTPEPLHGDVQHLFNSSGEWLGFRQGRYVFDTNRVWIAWLPWEEPEVVSRHGDYLGTICHDHRLYHFSNRRERGFVEAPPHPDEPAYPGYPGSVGYEALPPMARDVFFAYDETG